MKTMRYHFTPFRMVMVTKTKDECGQRCREEKTRVHGWWECTFFTAIMENSMKFPQKLKNKATK